MWVFYLISLPLTVGMVIFTLRYFAGPEVPRYVLFTVGYTWFCSLSMIILVPADIWTGYEDAGDFNMRERLKTSVHANLLFYLIVGSIGLVGLILLITMNAHWSGDIRGLAMALSNTFGLVTGAFLLGFGLVELPKTIWRNADWTTRQKLLSHKIAKMAVRLDDAHKDLSNAIVVAQATSTQMSKRDPLRPYMNVIDNMLTQMFKEDPSFKPQGGQLGENDMDYDTDEKSMATLRRHLRGARENYYRYKSEYMTYVMEALEMEDTIKNYEHRDSTGWKYISSFRPSRTGKVGSMLDTLEFIWRCILCKEFEKVLAIILGIMSAAIILAEATLLPSVDLSLFSILINSVKSQEVFVQSWNDDVLLIDTQADKRSELAYDMLVKMVARYAPPISFNFLNLIHLDDGRRTIFEQRMGNMDSAVPFFGTGFNKIYPLIMVIYTLFVASNFFDRVIDFFGSWKRFRFQSEADDMDGFDPSGVIILKKERAWLEEGRRVGEHVIPLARNFNGSDDIESGSTSTDRTTVEMKATATANTDTRLLKEDTHASHRYGSSREALSNKYAAIREQQTRQATNTRPIEKNIASTKVSLLDADKTNLNNSAAGPSSGLVSTWQSMKTGFQSFKTNIGAKKFIPLRQNPETTLVSHTSSESLDEIFQRLKRPSGEHGDNIEE
ncbi:hypothetical protein ACFE04_018691 [Oxalis oulophora]